MTSTHTSLAMMAAVLAFSVPASAQELTLYDTVGVWEVLIDPSVDNGCLINAEFEDGSDVRIGFENAGASGYLMAMNAAWGGIEDDTEYAITLDVDGTIYEGKGKGMHLDDVPGVDITFDSADFLLDVATKTSLKLSNADGPVMSIDLADSDKALESALACQAEQG